MIRSNLNFEKYIQAGLDIGTNKICCAISEIDVKTDTVRLLGIGNSNATSINTGAITHRDNLIDEIENAVNEAKKMSGVNIENIALGVDMFDCVMPTRNARNGMLFTSQGIINIKNKKWENDFSPIDEMGITWVDTMYSKAYLRHLFASGEMLGKQIASIHNLGFYLWLVREARKHIIDGDFREWKEKMVKQMDKRL